MGQFWGVGKGHSRVLVLTGVWQGVAGVSGLVVGGVAGVARSVVRCGVAGGGL